MELKQKFVTEDGAQFDTKAEAQDYLRKPLKTAALNKLNGDNAELTDWLLANESDISDTFESTKIQRVTKSEKAALEKALEAVAKTHATLSDDGSVSNVEKQFAFIIENRQAIADSFRWPSVKRIKEEDQAATIKGNFMVLTDNNEELSDWLIENKQALLDAFAAGIVKREVNPGAASALAEYQAAKKAGGEVFAAYQAKKAQEKAEKFAASKK